MALPPLSAAAAPASPAAVPGAAPAPDAMPPGGDDDGSESPWVPFVTIMKNQDTGEFMLVDGDEPDDDSEPEGPTFKDGSNLLKALMDKIQGKGDEQAGMESGFADDGGDSGMPQKPMPG